MSQFTLYGELKRKKGRGNLDWRHAMGPEPAKAFYEAFLSDLRGELPESSKLADGRFGAMMDVSLINDGPVTLSLDSRDGNGLAPVGAASASGRCDGVKWRLCVDGAGRLLGRLRVASCPSAAE